MNNDDRIRTLLQQAIPAVGEEHEPARDLWPELRQRIAESNMAAPAEAAVPRAGVPWFDWVLAGGVALVAIAFPAAVPVLFYYL